MKSMNSKAQYRRSKSGHQFLRIEGNAVTAVVNKEKIAAVSHQDNAMLAECYLLETDTYRKATEEEFNKAHAEALAICTLMKIV